jgi:hypothetical protein
MLVAVASVKSSPGSTTFAAALAAVWPDEPALLIEADPAGGDLGGRHGVPDDPGLASLATACRSGSVSLASHTARLGFGVDVVVAAAGRAQASAAIALLADTDAVLWAKERPTVLDVGRLEPGSPAEPLLDRADVVLVVTRGDILSLKRVYDADLSTEPARMVIVGPLVDSSDEIAATVGLPVAVEVPWDRRAAEVIGGLRTARRGWTRVGLPAAARRLATALAAGTVQTIVGERS